MLFKNLYVIKEMVNVERVIIELYMHMGGLLTTQEARESHSAIASCDSYASFVLSNLLRAYITR